MTMAGDDEIVIRNGLLKFWWNNWIRYYNVIMPGGVKVRAWVLLSAMAVLAFLVGRWAG